MGMATKKATQESEKAMHLQALRELLSVRPLERARLMQDAEAKYGMTSRQCGTRLVDLEQNGEAALQGETGPKQLITLTERGQAERLALQHLLAPSNGNGNGRPHLSDAQEALATVVLTWLSKTAHTERALTKGLEQARGVKPGETRLVLEHLAKHELVAFDHDRVTGKILVTEKGAAHLATRQTTVTRTTPPSAPEMREVVAGWLQEGPIREDDLVVKLRERYPMLSPDGAEELIHAEGGLFDDERIEMGDDTFWLAGSAPPAAQPSNGAGSVQSWIRTCPVSDVNFKSSLEQATAEDIRTVLEQVRGEEHSKGRVEVLERRLRALERQAKHDAAWQGFGPKSEKQHPAAATDTGAAQPETPEAAPDSEVPGTVEERPDNPEPGVQEPGTDPEQSDPIEQSILTLLQAGPLLWEEALSRMGMAIGFEREQAVKVFYRLEDSGRIKKLAWNENVSDYTLELPNGNAAAAEPAGPVAEIATGLQQAAEQSGVQSLVEAGAAVSEVGQKFLGWLLQMKGRTEPHAAVWLKKNGGLDLEASKAFLAELLERKLIEKRQDKKLHVVPTPMAQMGGRRPTEAEVQSFALQLVRSSVENYGGLIGKVAQQFGLTEGDSAAFCANLMGPERMLVEIDGRLRPAPTAPQGASAPAPAEPRGTAREAITAAANSMPTGPDQVWEQLVWLADKEDEAKRLEKDLSVAKRQYNHEVKAAVKAAKQQVQENWGKRIPEIEEEVEQTQQLVRKTHLGIIKQARKKVASAQVGAAKAAVAAGGKTRKAKEPKPTETASTGPAAAAPQGISEASKKINDLPDPVDVPLPLGEAEATPAAPEATPSQQRAAAGEQPPAEASDASGPAPAKQPEGDPVGAAT